MKCKSPVVKRSVVIANHKTSVSVEDLFWRSLKGIAAESDVTLSQLVGRIDHEREAGNLSSALRTFVLGYYRRRCGEDLAFGSVPIAMATATSQHAAVDGADRGTAQILQLRNGGDPVL